MCTIVLKDVGFENHWEKRGKGFKALFILFLTTACESQISQNKKFNLKTSEKIFLSTKGYLNHVSMDYTTTIPTASYKPVFISSDTLLNACSLGATFYKDFLCIWLEATCRQRQSSSSFPNPPPLAGPLAHNRYSTCVCTKYDFHLSYHKGF